MPAWLWMVAATVLAMGALSPPQSLAQVPGRFYWKTLSGASAVPVIVNSISGNTNPFDPAHVVVPGASFDATVALTGYAHTFSVFDRSAMAGMFQRFQFDATGQTRPGRNALAVKVFPVDHPGTPDTQRQVLGRDRGYVGKEIMRDVTEIMTIGYDCMMTVPDRNMGLIQEVWLDVTGPVDVRHPFVRSQLDLPDLNPARLTVSAELVNASVATVRGLLAGIITDPAGQRVAASMREKPSRSSRRTTADPTRPRCPATNTRASGAIWIISADVIAVGRSTTSARGGETKKEGAGPTRRPRTNEPFRAPSRSTSSASSPSKTTTSRRGSW